MKETMNKIYQTFSDKISYSADDISALFAEAKGWEGKYRQIMLLGKQLPPLPDEYKQDEFLVKGCESNVWFHYECDEQGNYHFAADSDARIVKGLVIIILAAFNQSTARQLADFDIEAYFSQLDLLKHLSPSRSNGIQAIVEQIKLIDLGMG
jgi:cysteine desulfuration protein SufE